MIGARRVVVTTGGKLAELARADHVPVVPVAGGFQPRAAVAYMTVAALQVAALCGVGPGMNSELDVAADHLEELVIEWGPEGPPDGLAKSLARALHGTVPVVAGAGLTTPIAYRWKTQVNENAKMPCLRARAARARPQRDRGLGLGQRVRPLLGRLPRRRRHASARQGRASTSRRSSSRRGPRACIASSRAARTTAERVFSLVLLGDLVSVYLAALRGVDPEPVEVLGRLKAELAAAG